MINMAFSLFSQQPFLTAEFEQKARNIFNIPPFYYVGNDELKYYFDLLKDAEDDDAARTARVLTCSTNVSCVCFACSHGEQDRSLEEDSVETSTGHEADDEDDESCCPSTDFYEEDDPITAENLHEQPNWSLGSENYGPRSPSLFSDPSACASPAETCSACERTDIDTSLWESDSEDQGSIIVVSDATELSVIVISDEGEQTVFPSPPLKHLDEVWNSTFANDGNLSDTMSWESPVPKKKLRRGLGFASPFEGLPDIKTKPIKPTKVLAVPLSPIALFSAANTWTNIDTKREKQ